MSLIRVDSIDLPEMGAGLSGIADKLSLKDDILSSAVNQDCVVVFSNAACTYCKKVQKLFEDDEIEYKNVEINSYGMQAGELVSKLRTRTGLRTVPQVFINGEFVGGFTDIETLREAGRLYNLIQQCSKNRKS